MMFPPIKIFIPLLLITLVIMTKADYQDKIDEVLNKSRDMRLLAYYSTTSITSLRTTTISMPSTCLQIMDSAAICTGRRKRRSFSRISVQDLK